MWIIQGFSNFEQLSGHFLSLLTVRTKHEHHRGIKQGETVMGKFMDGVAQGMGWAMAMSLMLIAIHAVPLMLR